MFFSRLDSVYFIMFCVQFCSCYHYFLYSHVLLFPVLTCRPVSYSHMSSCFLFSHVRLFPVLTCRPVSYSHMSSCFLFSHVRLFPVLTCPPVSCSHMSTSPPSQYIKYQPVSYYQSCVMLLWANCNCHVGHCINVRFKSSNVQHY